MIDSDSCFKYKQLFLRKKDDKNFDLYISTKSNETILFILFNFLLTIFISNVFYFSNII